MFNNALRALILDKCSPLIDAGEAINIGRRNGISVIYIYIYIYIYIHVYIYTYIYIYMYIYIYIQVAGAIALLKIT